MSKMLPIAGTPADPDDIGHNPSVNRASRASCRRA